MTRKTVFSLASLIVLVLGITHSAAAADGRISLLSNKLKGEAFAMSEDLRCNWTRVPQFGGLLADARTIFRLAGDVPYHSGYGHKQDYVYRDLEHIERRLKDMHRRLNELDYWLMNRHQHGHHKHGYGGHDACDTQRLHGLFSAMKYTLRDMQASVHHSHSYHKCGPACGPTCSHGSKPHHGYQRPSGYGYQKSGYSYGYHGLSLNGPRGFGLRIRW